MKKSLIYILFAGFFAISVNSCTKFLDVEPEGVILEEDALQTPRDLQLLLNSCYDVLSSANFMGGRYQNLAELLGDSYDGRFLTGDLLAVFSRNTTIFNSEARSTYLEAYLLNYRVNVLLESVDLIAGLDAGEKDRIVAEARFLRSVAMFELIRLYAQPFGYTADNSHTGIVIRTQTGIEPQPRNTVAEGYDLILSGMQAAENVLPTSNGGYATSWAVKGYLAKVYFQMNDFQNAFDYADEVISNGGFTMDPNIMGRFDAVPTSEAIFNLVSTGTFDNSASYYQSTWRSDGNLPTGRFNSSLYGLATDSTEGTDLRGENWYSVTALPTGEELYLSTRFNAGNFLNVPIVHLTELMLIRAEAAAELGNSAVAEADLNAIRARAGLNPIVGLPQVSLIQAIRAERRLELVCEGARFHDLRRQGALGENVTISGAPWDCPGMIIQLPDQAVAGTPGIELNPEGGCN